MIAASSMSGIAGEGFIILYIIAVEFAHRYWYCFNLDT